MVPAESLKTGILTGPTSAGKTALALALAERHGAIEIINADSLLVYRGLDIGTAKPTPEERAKIPHHLIDILEPTEEFTAGDFYRSALAKIEEIESRGKRALIVGGTGFYLKALLYGLWPAPKADPALRAELAKKTNAELYAELEKVDSESALRIGVNDTYRLVRALEIYRLGGKTPTELQENAPRDPNPRFALWVLDRANSELEPRIQARTRAMISAGLVQEVEALLARYPDSRALQSVGYAETIAYLRGERPAGRKLRPGLAGLEDEISLSTRQLVKRQRTWFRGQKASQWFTLDQDLEKFQKEFFNLYETSRRSD